MNMSDDDLDIDELIAERDAGVKRAEEAEASLSELDSVEHPIIKSWLELRRKERDAARAEVERLTKLGADTLDRERAERHKVEAELAESRRLLAEEREKSKGHWEKLITVCQDSNSRGLHILDIEARLAEATARATDHNFLEEDVYKFLAEAARDLKCRPYLDEVAKAIKRTSQPAPSPAAEPGACEKCGGVEFTCLKGHIICDKCRHVKNPPLPDPKMVAASIADFDAGHSKPITQILAERKSASPAAEEPQPSICGNCNLPVPMYVSGCCPACGKKEAAPSQPDAGDWVEACAKEIDNLCDEKFSEWDRTRPDIDEIREIIRRHAPQ